MSSAFTPESALVLVGVSHHTAPITLREKVAMGPEEARASVAGACGTDALREAMVLSTCNRTEVYAVAPKGGPAAASALLRLRAGDSRLEPFCYERQGLAVAQHLARVASGLDSMVLGEAQVLAQVRAAGALAREAGGLGPVLDRLLATALRAGKRARTETRIGTGAVSVASAAVALAAKALGPLAGRSVLVVGAGETGALAARHFEKEGAALTITNRTRERAVALASRVGGEAVPLERLREALAKADVAVCATRAPGTVLAAETVREAMRTRPERPLVLLDIAVPRDVDPAAANGENVLLYPIDALQAMADEGIVRRRREVPRVEAIIDEEVERFASWLHGLAALPFLRELREHFERVRAEEVKRSRKHFAVEEHEHLERLTRALVNKLLREPMVRLKAADPSTDGGLARLEAARELFGLGGAGAPRTTLAACEAEWSPSTGAEAAEAEGG